MAKLKAHKITVRKKEGAEGPMTGANTEILLDGKPLKMATGLKFEVSATSVAKVTIELLADVEIEGEVESVQVTPNEETTAPVTVEIPKPLPYSANLIEDPRSAHRPDPNTWAKQ